MNDFIKSDLSGDKKIYAGAAFLAVGAFISKILGALYRIPLTNLLGSGGIGLYQMVFPVYTVLLEFSGAGVPSALSKIISGYKGADKDAYAKRILTGSLRFFCLVGLVGTLLMALLGRPIAALQGDVNAYAGYLFMAPAVIFVSVISCYRGYFQGRMNMVPTAISQIGEQVIKLLFGLFFVKIFLPDVPLAVGGATLAVSISELAAFLFLFSVYKKSRPKLPEIPYEKTFFASDLKEIIKFTVPITLIGILIPASQVLDSFLIINFLNVYSERATALYGLLSGAANTVINLPVSLCYGLSVVAIPAVSSAKNACDRERKAKKTLTVCAVISSVFAAAVFFLCPVAVKILFAGLSEGDKSVTVNLIKLLSVNVVFLSVLQTENSVLIGKGKPYAPIVGLAAGIAVKTAVNCVLLRFPAINVYGGAIALIACYFTACLINLISLIRFKEKNESAKTCRREYAD